MTKLSVNVNKIATLRNSRGNNVPNLEMVTKSIIDFGADGITIHPRPDERHIKYEDVFNLASIVQERVEFNIEGFPSDRFMKMVLQVKPNQVTLVPDKDNVLTSLHGWDTVQEKDLLKNTIKELNNSGIRSSVFIHPEIKMVEGAASVNANRIELFTGLYAHSKNMITNYVECSKQANLMNIGVNAGHDLDSENLDFFIKNMPFLDEVSIGHGLISESLFLGLENTINLYKRILQ
ncbi:MAG: pyridoxine 5'-phosphate synthase [Flavobacteriales bacterium]|nr:pyridoxine 5'-phosphate synthase [Flavobacteriales bacterium]